MKYKGFIKNREEYELMKDIIVGKLDCTVNLNKRQRYRVVAKSTNFIVLNNLLYLKAESGDHKLVIPQNDIPQMKLHAVQVHSNIHIGMNKMEELCEKFYFNITREVIREVLRSCYVCSQSQPLKVVDRMIHIRAAKPNERWQLDLVDMREFSSFNGNISWIMVIVDVFSKFCFARGIPNKTALAVKKNLLELFYLFGAPQILQCDNGKEFVNSEIDQLCTEFKILRKFGRPRHPQSQGQVERLNQTLCRFLQKNLTESGGKNWMEILPKIIYNYNITIHSATKNTPMKLYLNRCGFNTVLKTDVTLSNENSDGLSDSESKNTIVKENEIENTDSNEIYLKRMRRNALVHISKYNFTVGDFVLVKKDFDMNVKTKKGKLDSFYSASCEIVELCSNNRARVKFDNGVIEMVSLIQLKKILK